MNRDCVFCFGTVCTNGIGITVYDVLVLRFPLVNGCILMQVYASPVFY